jgi:hypothetical protein
LNLFLKGKKKFVITMKTFLLRIFRSDIMVYLYPCSILLGLMHSSFALLILAIFTHAKFRLVLCVHLSPCSFLLDHLWLSTGVSLQNDKKMWELLWLWYLLLLIVVLRNYWLIEWIWTEWVGPKISNNDSKILVWGSMSSITIWFYFNFIISPNR